MEARLIAALERIGQALERLAPAPVEPDFAGARLFSHDAATGAFVPQPDRGADLEVLVGIERQKGLVTDALARFSAGRPVNHLLLWGARGTGKSSLAKAAFLNAADAAPSLKMIEIKRDDLAHLPRMFEAFRRRSERFVVFCDDLSFEAGAATPRTLKSALEGGLAGPPENALFIATSNRRHLMARGHEENGDGIIAAEMADEDISVSDRFGLWIGFPPMSQATYLAAVRAHAARLDVGDQDIEAQALAWARQRGGRSGRTAWQFARQAARLSPKGQEE